MSTGIVSTKGTGAVDNADGLEQASFRGQEKRTTL
jgi:hypothetical protein